MCNQQGRQRNTILAVVILAGIIISGCGPRDKEGAQPMGPPEVGVVTMKPERAVLTNDLPGRTSAYRVAEIRPQVNGLILKRVFEEGSDVEAGDLLYQIDPAPYQAAYDQAAAAVAMAEANLTSLRLREKRFKKLVANHAVGQQEYDDALAAVLQMEAQLKSSQAAQEIAKINLSYTPIKAPIPGRIGLSNVTEGALVTAYQAVPLATIQQLDPIYVDVPQSTTELLNLKSRLADGRLNHDGDDQNKVKIVMEDGTTYPLEGTLEFRDITVEPTTGSVILRIVVPNPGGELLPGMFVRTILKEGVKEDAIFIPQSSVRRNQKGEPYVLAVDVAGKVEMRKLSLDRALGDRWLVASGLDPDDRVVVEGLQLLKPGLTVKAVPFQEKKDSKPEPGNPSSKTN